MKARVWWLLLVLVLLGGWALWFKLMRRPQVLVGAPQITADVEKQPRGASGIAMWVPPSGADWESEILAGYGLPWVRKVHDRELAQAVKAGVRTWLVPNVELDSSTREALEGAVKAGAWLVELGPKPAVCDLPALEPGASARFVVTGEGLDGVRWPGSVSTVPGCEVHGCPGVTLLARVDDGGVQRPLVTRRTLGQGTCTRWHGDFAAVMQRLRQGDPARANSRSPGHDFKPSDLFAGDLEPRDYDVPSADRLGFALAAQIVATPGPDVMLAPLPAGARGLVIFTADQDFVPGAGVLAQSAALGHAGFTVTLTSDAVGGKPDVVFAESEPGLMAAEDVSVLAELGHDVGVHPNLVGLPEAAYRQVLVDHVAAFEEAYGVKPRIVRNHHLIWDGYMKMARLQAAAGLALNLDYVTARSAQGYVPGFMTGSGLMLRFVDRRGRVLPIFQLATQIDDYLFLPGEASSAAPPLTVLTAGAIKLIAISQREQVPVTLLHHPAWWHESHGAWQKAILGEAARQGARVWSAGRFLAFVEETRRTELERADERFDLTNIANESVLLLEGAAHWRAGGKPVRTQALTLGGRVYQALPLPVGHIELDASER